MVPRTAATQEAAAADISGDVHSLNFDLKLRAAAATAADNDPEDMEPIRSLAPRPLLQSGACNEPGRRDAASAPIPREG